MTLVGRGYPETAGLTGSREPVTWHQQGRRCRLAAARASG